MRLAAFLIGLFLVSTVWSGGVAVSRQVVYEGCRDIRGFPVASLESPINNVAVAGLAPSGAPVIWYNPNILSYFQPITRVFWYYHECAHHALGHSFRNIPTLREKQADCWAIHTMSRRGLLRGRALAIIQSDLSRLSGDGWIYLPGPQRAMSLIACQG